MSEYMPRAGAAKKMRLDKAQGAIALFRGRFPGAQLAGRSHIIAATRKSPLMPG